MTAGAIPSVGALSPRPLRLIHYCPGIQLELGGVVRAVLDWCSTMAAEGNDVTLVTYKAPDVPPFWTGTHGTPKVVIIPSARHRNAFVPAEAIKIWKDVLSEGGVVHLHTPWILSNLQMAAAARQMGVPYVVTIHGMLNDWAMSRRSVKKRLFLILRGRRYLRNAARLHYTAAAERDQAQKWIRGPKPVVLPYIIDLRQYDPLPGPAPAQVAFPAALAGDMPKLLYLSRIDEQKGTPLLIEAAGLLHKAGRRFKLLIAGTCSSPAYEAAIHEQVARLNLTDVVTFLGLVTGVEKVSLYQSADLMVLPTMHENFGLVLIESMAAGTPVVTTRGTDIWQEIQSAGGTIVEKDPVAISAEIARLVDDRAALPALGHRGRDWVLDRFNVKRLAADYKSLYEEMMREAAGK